MSSVTGSVHASCVRGNLHSLHFFCIRAFFAFVHFCIRALLFFFTTPPSLFTFRHFPGLFTDFFLEELILLR
jgi:hypothetical protein